MSGERRRRFQWPRAVAVSLLALGAVAGTVLLVLEQRQPVEAQSAPVPVWSGFFPAYPGAQPVVPISDGLRVGGLSARVGYHTSEDAPEEVRRYYADAFRKEGLAVQVSEGEAPVLGVTALDGARHHQRAVTVLPGGGGSVVFLSLSPIDVAPVQLPPLRLPVPPDARLVSDSAADDGGRITRTVTMVSQLEPEAAAAVLEERLLKARFQGVARPRSARAILLRARAPWGAEVTYTITGGPERPTAIVAVSGERQEAP